MLTNLHDRIEILGLAKFVKTIAKDDFSSAVPEVFQQYEAPDQPVIDNIILEGKHSHNLYTIKLINNSELDQ